MLLYNVLQSVFYYFYFCNISDCYAFLLRRKQSCFTCFYVRDIYSCEYSSMSWKEGRENGKMNLGEKEMSVASPQGKGNKKEWYLL